MRVWLAKARTYLPAINDEEVFYSFGVAKVIKSKNESYKVGDFIFG